MLSNANDAKLSIREIVIKFNEMEVLFGYSMWIVKINLNIHKWKKKNNQ